MSYPPLSDRFMLKKHASKKHDRLLVSIITSRKSQKKPMVASIAAPWHFYFSPRESERDRPSSEVAFGDLRPAPADAAGAAGSLEKRLESAKGNFPRNGTPAHLRMIFA